jgi:hypothetical protein
VSTHLRPRAGRLAFRLLLLEHRVVPPAPLVHASLRGGRGASALRAAVAHAVVAQRQVAPPVGAPAAGGLGARLPRDALRRLRLCTSQSQNACAN